MLGTRSDLIILGAVISAILLLCVVMWLLGRRR